ncbi:oligosaccharide flippase family protein [Bacillus aerolatus]|uniref:Oligosaccharide flippase family protein n=1 Tax=Bacillus aerolatus TaxID=2653354 RepID=A0A6I1FGQ3_9BACI|nr:oligosaccharide flippase family protein [Bacillus aerolatus]KAB7707402.1 oligosaccharide flippase family protein [Bacillus aerolatus]
MRIKDRLNSNRFLKNFATLFSATLLAQFINVAASPFLTRIYSPEEFGYFSFYLSVCSLLIVYTTGRYEFAINTVKLEKESQALFKVVVILSTFFTILILLAEQIFYDQFIGMFGLEKVSSLLIYIPVTLLAMGIMQGLNYYLNKHKEFGVLSKGKVLRSSVTSGSSIIFGLIGLHSVGLILANVLGYVISVVYQTIVKRLSFLFDFRNYQFDSLKQTAKIHRHYPLYNSTSAFFDNMAAQAPVFILMRFFSEAIVGFYSLTIRVAVLPISLISTSVAQVFLSEIAELYSDGKPFGHVLRKVLILLSVIGIVPVLLLVTAGPWGFALVFGEEWRKAGELSQILAFGYYAKFVVSPLSVVFFVKQKVKLLSIIQGIRAVSTVSVLWISSTYLDIEAVILAYSIHEILFYIVYLFFIFRVSRAAGYIRS